MTAHEQLPRTRGRPPEAEGSDLKSHLLDVAEERFAERGFAATTVRSIATEADVNPALVHYYFGSKRGLLIAVLDRVFEPLAEAMAGLQTSGEVTLGELTELLYKALGEHPALPRLVGREVLLSGGELQALFIREYAPRLGGSLPPLISKQQARGRVHPELEPAKLAMLILSLCIFPFIARPLAENVLGIDYDAGGLQSLQQHVDRLLHCGIEP